MAMDIFQNRYPKKFLHQLVSSQLDMDRLDYLKRDSFFTGVTEGVIGSDRIIKMLNVLNDQLVVDEKGIYSIEKFLIARRLMYWQVYLHKTGLVAEQLLIRRQLLGLRKRLRNPGLVDEVPPRNVVVGAVAAPGPAAQRGRLAHAVPQVAAVGSRLGLVDHYPGRAGDIRQLHDVFIAAGIYAAGMALALIGLDGIGVINGVVDVFHPVKGHDHRQLLAGERKIRAEAGFRNDEELLALRQLDCGHGRQLLGRLGNDGRVQMAVVPDGVLQPFLFLLVNQITALMQQLLQHLVIDGINQQHRVVGRAGCCQKSAGAAVQGSGLIKVRWVDTSAMMAGVLEAKKLKGESSKYKAETILPANSRRRRSKL